MIFETFARRKRQENRNGEPEIYTYDQAPQHMRTKYARRYLRGSGFITKVAGITNHRQTPPPYGSRSTAFVERRYIPT
jgi:hypothetical protein